MALPQQKFREIILQLLYSREVAQPENKDMVELIMTELAVSKKNVCLAQERVQKIENLFPEIDSLITSVSTSYSFERIQIVTKNILRLGIFELLFDDQIPPKVAIAESIRLSRKFSTPESASFVNAILDHLYQKKCGIPSNPQQMIQQSQALLESEQISAHMVQKKITQEKEEDENSKELC